MLLQARSWSFTPDSDPTGVIFLGGLGLAVLFLIVWSMITSRRHGRSRAGRSSGSNYRSQARHMRMPRPHLKLFEQLIREFKVSSPNTILSSEGQLDILLKKAIAATEHGKLSTTQKEQRKHLIYQIKQIVDAAGQPGRILPSSQAIRLNTELSLHTSSGATIRSYVVTNLKNALCVVLPSPEDAKQIPKNSPVGVTFLHGGTDVYSFTTRLMGFKKMKDLPCMILEHSQNLRQTQKRKSRRKELDRPAFFYRVNVVQSGEGKNAVKQAVVNTNQRNMGSLMDVSAGGCAIATQNTLPPGSLIKIVFDAGAKMQITTFGKVRHISNAPKRGRVMHIMFTTVTRQNLNRIRDFIYGYGRSE
jgi:c-di-GMP-binding flagellar brake protein YcgR